MPAPTSPRVQFDHIAIALSRMPDALAFLVGQLGGIPAYGFSSEAFRFGQWRFRNDARIEILEPRGENGFLHRFLDQHGPGVHHVTFKVPSLRAACDGAEAAGYTVLGYDDSDPRWGEAFLHPRQALGIVVQLAQTDGGDFGGGSGGFRALPPVADPPPPVSVVGLRTRAHSREGARRQWAEILRGQCEGGSTGDLTFCWPDSPMRLVVEIDPARGEGPVCVELASDRPLSLPSGPHPVLGTAFVQL
jgi:methylmalonyl-CoA/ethylmalonyl-CoA epimerase